MFYEKTGKHIINEKVLYKEWQVFTFIKITDDITEKKKQDKEEGKKLQGSSCGLLNAWERK